MGAEEACGAAGAFARARTHAESGREIHGTPNRFFKRTHRTAKVAGQTAPAEG